MKKLSLKTKLGFGIGDLGGNLFFTIIGFYLLFFLTDVINLSAGLAGTALLIGKIWDAITDPIVGYRSDITKSKWGRRRPYIFSGSVFLFFSMTAMFANPEIENQILLFIYISILYSLLNTAYTLVNIPYSALLPELTQDYNERTVLTGYRMSFAVTGTFIGAGTVLPLVAFFTNKNTGWLITGIVMGAIMLITAMITVFSVKEPDNKKYAAPESFKKSYKTALGSKPFILALIPWMLHTMGVTIIQTSVLYYFKYIYQDETLFQLAMISMLASSLLFIPA